MMTKGNLLLCLVGFVLCVFNPAYAKEYIRPDAPEVKIPLYKGQRYEALVPDTLDIAERAKLAINGLTGPLDPDDDYSLYWLVNFHNSPPLMKKEGYINLGAKFRQALPLLRIITGSDLHDEVDRAWMNNLLKAVGPDGLIYARKREGNPFTSLSGCGTGRLFGAMIVYYLRDGDPRWKEIIEGIIDRYGELAIDKGDYAYFTQGNFNVNQEPNSNLPMPVGIHAVDAINARLVQGFGQYYRLTGYEPAKELGEKICNYLRFHSEYFGPNGEWLPDQLDTEVYPGRGEDIHFHAHTMAILNMLELALATDNQELIDFCRTSFDWGIHRNSTIEGQSETASEIGFFLEYLIPYYPVVEICEVADMIAIALKLSSAGEGEYWDAADGWIRNHFFESQMLSTDWIDRTRTAHWPRVPTEDETDENVTERNVGAFFSWATANDGCPTRPITPGDHIAVGPATAIGMMHCCMGNASRAIYYIWENILEYDEGELTVHLLLNRASSWADLKSYIPYQGKVELDIKKPLKQLAVRIPQWIETGSADVTCKVNGDTGSIQWEDRYVLLGGVKAGDRVTLSFPIHERTIQRRVYGAPHETVIGGYEYESITLKGNTVVHIDPPGKNYPYYQREKYRSNEAPLVKVERFLSDEKIDW